MARRITDTPMPRRRTRKTICLDFDGVVHLYRSGWQGSVTAITDPPTLGVRDAVDKLLGKGFDVKVYSTRCAEPQGYLAVQNWLRRHEIRADVARSKPPAVLYVDDRGYRFDGDWDALLAFVDRPENLDPWQVRDLTPEVPTLNVLQRPGLIDRLTRAGLLDDETDPELISMLQHIDRELDETRRQ